MRETQTRKNIQDKIIQEKMGKSFIYTVDNIKDEQCFCCKNFKTNKCRLNIDNERCKNYEKKMDKRKC